MSKMGPCYFCGGPGQCCDLCGVYLCDSCRPRTTQRAIAALKKIVGFGHANSDCK